VVLLVPFLDRGRRSRRLLNALLLAAIVFFITMTAWGWFSGADEVGRRVALAALLTLIVLTITVPFTQSRSGIRRTLYGFMMLVFWVLVAAVGWESL
jgi:hypothetical protein